MYKKHLIVKLLMFVLFNIHVTGWSGYFREIRFLFDVTIAKNNKLQIP